MRREAPAAARCRQAILDEVAPYLPPAGLVLEIASGSGTHVAHFAEALPALTFQRSDPGREQRR
jgi:tRNA G46 methylase TrmB